MCGGGGGGGQRFEKWFSSCLIVADYYSHYGILQLLYMFCFALLCVDSSFAIILMGKRELVALLSLSSRCLVIVV